MKKPKKAPRLRVERQLPDGSIEKLDGFQTIKQGDVFRIAGAVSMGPWRKALADAELRPSKLLPGKNAWFVPVGKVE